ncbi:MULTISPECIES: FAD-linked oxidase C-terminal domain-containing protein [unclassified Bradyrhizobium]|uniref:FAD-binding oxidoreductase n=1 Tax=unclassified Bradyrhizobium TaxID=2631580 RepID=UPI001FF75BF1|nr:MULTISPECIES: FAD-linked oxidase C-terminal domain-containing protein [unclassified Bradyrhizobium]
MEICTTCSFLPASSGWSSPSGWKEGILSLQLYDTAAALGGTFSAEHGVGRFKKHLLERYGDLGRIAAMRRIKTAFDPADIMNAGTIVRPLGEKSAC